MALTAIAVASARQGGDNTVGSWSIMIATFIFGIGDSTRDTTQAHARNDVGHALHSGGPYERQRDRHYSRRAACGAES